MVLLDMHIPGNHGVSLLEDIRQINKELPVLLMDFQTDFLHVVRAFKAGANGYLTRTEIKSHLLQAVNYMMEGRKKYILPEVAELLASDLNKSATINLHENLSFREREILRLQMAGKTPKQIAHELNLSIKTVSTYRTRALRKMNMKNHVEFISHVIRHEIEL